MSRLARGLMALTLVAGLVSTALSQRVVGDAKFTDFAGRVGKVSVDLRIRPDDSATGTYSLKLYNPDTLKGYLFTLEIEMGHSHPEMAYAVFSGRVVKAENMPFIPGVTRVLVAVEDGGKLGPGWISFNGGWIFDSLGPSLPEKPSCVHPFTGGAIRIIIKK